MSSREAVLQRIKERKERRARGELPSQIESANASQVEDETELPPLDLPPSRPVAKADEEIDEDYEYLMAPQVSPPPPPTRGASRSPPKTQLAPVPNRDSDYDSLDDSQLEEAPKPPPLRKALPMPSKRQGPSAGSTSSPSLPTVTRIQKQSYSQPGSPKEAPQLSLSGTILSPRARGLGRGQVVPRTRKIDSPKASVWRKSPGSSKIISEEERRIRVGTRSAIETSPEPEQEPTRRRGMTEELEGFMSGLGINTTTIKKKPPPSSSSFQKASPSSPPRSPPRSPRSPRPQEGKPMLTIGRKTPVSREMTSQQRASDRASEKAEDLMHDIFDSGSIAMETDVVFEDMLGPTIGRYSEREERFSEGDADEEAMNELDAGLQELEDMIGDSIDFEETLVYNE